MDNISNILYIILAILGFVLMGLVMTFVIVKSREKQKDIIEIEEKEKTINVPSNIKVVKEYETKSIFDFMEFENVKDNMIIQKEGKVYLMAIECQGINYDLMSEIEKTSVEQGFATFLNTLKEPIQIYIQTRTVNLEKNINNYKERLRKVKDDLNLKEYKLKQYAQQEDVNEKTLKDKRLEVLRQTNLYEYGKDIIKDTEKMSLSKNILRKKYYIVIKYFYEPVDVEEEGILAKEEIADIAFSNLYTKASSLIRVLSRIGVIGKTLNSFELVDLLYNAYNRDYSEVFGIEKALEAGYNEIYVDAQSSIDKKINMLNKEIKLRAETAVRDTLEEIEDERKEELKNIEDNIEDIILELAKNIIQDDKNNISENTRSKALKKIEKVVKKGEVKSDGKKETKESK